MLGGLVLAFGICIWIDGLVGCIGGKRRTLLINPVMLLPWAGYGVLRLRQGWRRFLLVLCWILVAMIGVGSFVGVIGFRAPLGINLPGATGWQFGLTIGLLLGSALACIHVLCRPEIAAAFRLPAGTGRRETRAVWISLSVCLPLVLGASMMVSSKGAELSPLRARIEELFPEQLRFLRENRGGTLRGPTAQLFATPGILGAGWQTSRNNKHWVKLERFYNLLESTLDDMGWGTAELDSGGTVDYVTYKGTGPADDGIVLIVDRRFLDEAAP